MSPIRSLDEGAQRRNPGWAVPDFAAPHPGCIPYSRSQITITRTVLPFRFGCGIGGLSM